MPVSDEIALSNRTQTERLRQLAAVLQPSMAAIRLSNGWNIAGALGHIAFWDRQRLCLLRRWSKGDMVSGAYHGDVFNEAMPPVLELLPLGPIVRVAIETAEELDGLLLELSDSMLAESQARPDAPYLNRGDHRGHHLDQIARALKSAGFSGFE